MPELQTAKVESLIRLRWRTRLRLWWFERKRRKLLSEDGRRMLDEAEQHYEREFLFGKDEMLHGFSATKDGERVDPSTLRSSS